MKKTSHQILSVLVGAMLVLASASGVRADTPADSQVKPPVILPTPVEDDSDTSEPSAEEKLSGLLADRPEVPVTGTREGPPPVKKASPFPPDGSRIVARHAWLGFDVHSDWYVLHFVGGDEGPDLADLRILPSELLSAMEAVLAEDPDPVFEVGGEISLYQGDGYILLANVVVVAAPADQPATQAATAPSTAPATDKPPSASDVLAQMLTEEPASPIITVETPVAGPVQTGSVGPVQVSQTVTPKSYGMVVWRLVRVLPAIDGRWMEVRFESDNNLQEPPLRILPSALLTTAQKWTNAAKGRTIKLRVTGQITQYKGRAYLMLRNVFEEREMGQF